MKRPPIPSGTTHVNTCYFHHLIFIFHSSLLYHIEAHLSGYVPFTFGIRTSIIKGVGASKARTTDVRSCLYGGWTKTSRLSALCRGSWMGYSAVIGWEESWVVAWLVAINPSHLHHPTDDFYSNKVTEKCIPPGLLERKRVKGSKKNWMIIFLEAPLYDV